MKKEITKILIANRGEIALRVIKTCQKMGISTVAVFSDADREALYVQEADEAVALGESSSTESYLNQDKVIQAAKRTHADAIHPGYGFFAENADFAQKCAEHNITFIGPKPHSIAQMGSKIESRQLMENHQVPIIPGFNELEQTPQAFLEAAQKIEFPVLIKASAGGGGRGMRIVSNGEELTAAFESAQREAKNAFGDETLYLEKYLSPVRHIEFQILGDQSGQVVHCFERECSIQRRHQKIIEETPSPVLTDELRQKMGHAAVQAGKAINYEGAGTVEFVLDANLQFFYFLEVNTRLQVEHPITEEVTGLDLVEWQIRVARGEALDFTQDELSQNGHAIECRIYAEDPNQNFAPATGQLLYWKPADLPGIRYDSGVETGSDISIFYDPMIAKVIAYGEDRQTAIARMDQALKKTISLGLVTNQTFLSQVLNHTSFKSGNFLTTTFIEDNFSQPIELSEECQIELALVAISWQQQREVKQRSLLPGIPSDWRNIPYQQQFQSVEIAGKVFEIKYGVTNNSTLQCTIDLQHFEVEVLNAQSSNLVLSIDGLRKSYTIVNEADILYVHSRGFGAQSVKFIPRFPEPQTSEAEGGYQAPMPAKILKVLVDSGQQVEKGESLLIIESMKMETTISAFSDGKVTEVFVQEGDLVESGTTLLALEELQDS